MSLDRQNTLTFYLSAKHKAEGQDLFPSRGEVLKSILGKLRAPKAIVCLQSLSVSSFAVTFSGDSKPVRDCLALEGFTLNGQNVSVAEVQPRYVIVNTRNAPFEMEDLTIKNFFESFGTVIEVIRVRDGQGYFTGDRQVRMSVTRDIPSMVKILGFPIFIRYRGQRKCCRYCNHFDHVINRCPFRLNRLCIRCGSINHVARDCLRPWSLETSPLRVDDEGNFLIPGEPPKKDTPPIEPSTSSDGIFLAVPSGDGEDIVNGHEAEEIQASPLLFSQVASASYPSTADSLARQPSSPPAAPKRQRPASDWRTVEYKRGRMVRDTSPPSLIPVPKPPPAPLPLVESESSPGSHPGDDSLEAVSVAASVLSDLEVSDDEEETVCDTSPSESLPPKASPESQPLVPQQNLRRAEAAFRKATQVKERDTSPVSSLGASPVLFVPDSQPPSQGHRKGVLVAEGAVRNVIKHSAVGRKVNISKVALAKAVLPLRKNTSPAAVYSGRKPK